MDLNHRVKHLSAGVFSATSENNGSRTSVNDLILNSVRKEKKDKVNYYPEWAHIILIPVGGKVLNCMYFKNNQSYYGRI